MILTYRDDDQPYIFTNSRTITVREPLLHIGKHYTTPALCRVELFTDNFNDGNSASWATTGTGWALNNHRFRQNANGSNRVALAGNLAWQNYAYAALLHSTDTSGQMSLIFRANYYRFAWDRGTPTAVGSNGCRAARYAVTLAGSRRVPSVRCCSLCGAIPVWHFSLR